MRKEMFLQIKFINGSLWFQLGMWQYNSEYSKWFLLGAVSKTAPVFEYQHLKNKRAAFQYLSEVIDYLHREIQALRSENVDRGF